MDDRKRLKDWLEGLYGRYNRAGCIAPDPLQFVYRFADPADREIVALLSAMLAYGRVKHIENSLNRLFAILGRRPAAFVREFRARDRRRLQDFRHRFTGGEDIADLLEVLSRLLARHDSLEGLFLEGFRPEDANIVPALTRFCGSLEEGYRQRFGCDVGHGFMYLVSNPARGSAAKRLNLFLRWMVRRDHVDPGLWTRVCPSRLIVPMDVHMARLTRQLGFHSHANISQRTAVEVSRKFAQICPEDPVRYDFCLCRAGMEGLSLN